MSILSGIITSKIRIQILMSLFLNPGRIAYLRELADEHSASPSQVKAELEHLLENGLLLGDRNGNKVYYKANQGHPLFPELNSMVRKSLGMDRILDSIVERLGNLEQAILLDDYAEGKDTGIIDLLLIGNIDQRNLNDLRRKTEKYISRKIRTLCLTAEEYENMRGNLARRPQLLMWVKP